MLGRQQIAGIPTAIHELFKNSHDAYAERVEVDYFRRNRVLVLRDDGYGMTREDVENRWLTLGTESRVNANHGSGDQEWRGPKKLPKRSIMGEKGIGRLAIAVIAPITILMSRASRPDGLKDLVVALVHWGLFEQPGLDVSSIDVPLEEFAGGTLPTRDDIGRLADRVVVNLKALEEKIAPAAFKQLTDDLDRVRAIGPDMLDKTLNKNDAGAYREDPLTLTGKGYGTHFIVLPVAPELDDDIDGKGERESSKLERNLLGFSNAMASDEPVIKTEFRDHSFDGVIERIGPSSFFTSDDFEKTDHYFEGGFDEFGQFVGKVSVYGRSREFVCNWTDGGGRASKCGPFSFRYGYVQGRASESRLSPEDWSEMTSKTERVGGIYIYRDGIRVLPYGNSDVDWLDIEKRRTYSARDWFFSYRRGFGYVGIKHSENGALTEKAGREGFRENLAYRDFRSILVNLFRQLAYEFFRTASPQGDDYNEGKGVLIAQAELLRKQKNKADQRRKLLQSELDEFFEYYNSGYFESESSDIINVFKAKLDLIGLEFDLGDFASRLRQLDLEAKQRLRILSGKVQLILPRGLALTKKLQRDWVAYESISEQLKRELLEPLRSELDDQVRKAGDGRIAASERRNIAIQDIEREKENIVRDLASLRRETSSSVERMQSAIHGVLKDEFSDFRVNVEKLVDEFAKRTAEKPDELDGIRSEIEKRFLDLKSREFELLGSLKRQMIELSEGVQARETLDDRFAALESRNQVLEEQIEFYSDFAQMGMSVGILQHEFEGASRGIRSAMLELKPWADRNPPLASIYKKLRDHIEHLEGYLKVLDPLGRRLYRSTVEVSGSEILSVVRGVFSEPLETFSIRLDATLAFRGFTVQCKSSALIGAFVNVIDNAIYWLNSRAQGEKRIILDADNQGFLISNNGPGIEERIRRRIFDFGETQKPGGRGMGLAISQQALRREGLDIELVQSGLNVSPEFRIFSKDSQGE
ncbi:ATP-binding protein [Pseudomonas oryzihabitans]|uniref:ATP-binding protein n=1 Tax=Pseudomonas oryzihabitans TaxID=47885 RepID=UPI001F0D77B5|nr:ATP-binding protein [Pseudomonas psychrotolerans]